MRWDSADCKGRHSGFPAASTCGLLYEVYCFNVCDSVLVRCTMTPPAMVLLAAAAAAVAAAAVPALA
jgi:hypothetical protein